MARAPIPQAVQEEVLTKSARRCALCYGLDGSLAQKEGQIAHVDRDHSNAALKNLAFLCLEHHDKYDSRRSQSKGFIPGELLVYRESLLAAISRGDHVQHSAPRTPPRPPPEVIEHDRAAFRKADALLSEGELRRILDDIGTDHSFRDRWGEKLEAFCRHFDLESNRFLLEADLAPVTKELVASLTALLEFLTRHFFTFPKKQDNDHPDGTRYCLYPEWNVDRGPGDPRYGPISLELFGVLEAASAASAKYRQAVKRTLLV